MKVSLRHCFLCFGTFYLKPLLGFVCRRRHDVTIYPILRSFQTPRNRVVAKWCILQFEVTISKFLSNVLFRYLFIYLFDLCLWCLLSFIWLLALWKVLPCKCLFLGLKIILKLFCYLWCCFSGNKLNSITNGNGMHVLSWSCGRNVHMKRSFCIYSLFGGKKENNEKNDDAPSKVCSENFVTVDVHRFLIYIYIHILWPNLKDKMLAFLLLTGKCTSFYMIL